MNSQLFGMDPNNINLNAGNPGHMNNFPIGDDMSMGMPFIPGMFPMMNVPPTNLGSNPQQNN